LALQVLVDKGFLVAKKRSGLFVSETILQGQAGLANPVASSTGSVDWSNQFVSHLGQQRNIEKPANWQNARYPFIYGQFDTTLMPLKDWRACAHETLSVTATKAWSQDFIDRDYDSLVNQIQHRLLPARGIVARRDEILITAGAQMACYLLANVLIGPNTRVGIEDPGYPDARNIFNMRSQYVKALAIDEHGLVPSRQLAKCNYAYVTPSHQCPTTVTMPLDRRHEILALAKKQNIILFEDDHESELNFSGQPLAALKSLDTEGRVIYIGSLSKTLAHGLRIGYVVAPSEVIKELRALRRLVMRHTPTNNAHTASLFIAQGHHDAFIRRLNLTYKDRRQTLEQAFKEYLPDFTVTASLGGSGAWVRGPANLDATALAHAAAKLGVLIEPGNVFFNKPHHTHQPYFRMGYSAISQAIIDEGVLVLSKAYQSLTQSMV
jgi:GntR family transcriptional regulator/MocR family aminotransferase